MSGTVSPETSTVTQVLELVSGAALAVDPDGEAVVEANGEAEELFGRSVLADVALSELVAEGSLAPALDRALDGERSTETVGLAAHDGVRWVETAVGPVDADGRRWAVVAVEGSVDAPDRPRSGEGSDYCPPTGDLDGRRVEDLGAATERLVGADSGSAVAETVVDVVESILDRPFVAVWRAENDRLRTVATTDRTRSLAGDPEGPLVHSGDRVWDVYEAGEFRVIDEFDPGDTASVADLRSVVLAPLGDYGLLTVGATEPDAFDRVDEHTARIIARSATAVLDRIDREREVRERDRHLRTVVDNAPVVLFAFDADGTFTHSEGAALSKLGLSPGEAVGESVFDRYADFPEVIAACERALAGDRVSTTLELGGTTFEVWFNPVSGPDGVVEEVVGVAVDVTDRATQQRRLRAVADAAEELLFADDEAAVADHLVELAAATLDEEMTAFWRYDPDERTLVPAAGSEATGSGNSNGPRTIPEGTDEMAAFQRDRPTVVDDYSTLSRPAHPGYPVGSVALFPVGEYGLLGVCKSTTEGFDRSERDLVTVLARAASAALDRLDHLRELYDRQQRLRTVLDNAPVGLFAYDPDGVVIRGEGRVFEGPADADPVVGRRVEELLDQPTILDAVDRALSGEPSHATFTVEDRTFETWHQPVFEDGRLQRVVGVATDVTPVYRQRRRLQRLNESMPDLFDADSEAEVGAVATDILRSTVEKSVVGYWRYDPGADVLRPVALAERTRQVVRTDEFDFVLGEGTVSKAAFDAGERRYVSDYRAAVGPDVFPSLDLSEVVAEPVGDHGVLAMGACGEETIDQSDLDLVALLAETVAAALDRVEREAELALLDEVVERAAVALTILDPDGSVVYCNAGFEDLTGYDRSAALGRTLDFLAGPGTDDRSLDRLRTAVEDGEAASVEVLHYRADGTAFWNQVDVVPITDADGDLTQVLQFQRDVTDQVRRRRQSEVLNRVLRHNLRNDLGVVAGYAELLEDHVEADPHRGYLETIVEKADGLVELADKVRRGLDHLDGDRDARIPVSRLLEDVAAEFRAAYPGLDVGVDPVDDDRDRYVDRTLRIALREAVENAVEHGGTDPEVRVVAVPVEDDVVELRVVDDGPGVPEVEREAVAAGQETPLTHGAGIGLWLVTWTVATVGGQVSIRREDDRTVVSLRIPVTDGPSSSALRASGSAEVGGD